MNCQRDRILKGRCLLFLYLIGLRKNQPDVLRCLPFFYLFIPTGCSFNIFCIFGRRGVDGQPDVLPFLHQRTRLLALKIAQAGFCLDSRQEIAQTNLILLIQLRCHCCPVHRALAIQPQ